MRQLQKVPSFCMMETHCMPESGGTMRLSFNSVISSQLASDLVSLFVCQFVSQFVS